MADGLGGPKPSSLREIYSPPLSDWSFPSAAQTSASSGASSRLGIASSSPSPAWSAGASPSRPRVLDLSPSTLDADDFDPGFILDTRTVLKWVISAAVLQYATTGIAMPFEVAKTLMQVQWIPKDSIEGETFFEANEDDDDSDKDDASMSEASGESYFHDPAREAFSTAMRTEERVLPTDRDGYVMRNSVNDESTRLDYVIPIGPTDGVWSMMKRIREFRTEGWPALWKSQLISTVVETLNPFVQGTIQSFLLSALAPSSTIQPYPVPPSRLPTSHLLIALASHTMTGVLLSPLDLVRTRLIVQSSHPAHKTYSNSIDALRSIVRDEGGFKMMYTHPALFIPTLLDHTVRPLLTLATPIFLRAYFGIEEDTHPLSYAVATTACASVALVATLPIETIRRRLQVQRRGVAALGSGSKGYQACVELNPRPYSGVIDAVWRIVKEERSSPRRRRPVSRARRSSTSSSGGGRRGSTASRKGKEREEFVDTFEEDELIDDGWFASTGVAQLYRGFSMGLTANAVVFALSAFSGFSSDNTSSGWTEL